MNSASQILHAHLGSPSHEDCSPMPIGACWNCGGAYSTGMSLDAFLKSSLTDQNTARAPLSSLVCEACVYVRSRFAEVPGRPPKEGKEHGGRFTNYSHLYDAGTYENRSKGEKPAILAWLRGPRRGPWFAAIADSGQKHTLPYARVNPGDRGIVRFDDRDIRLPGADGWRLVDDAIALLTAGATKDEIGTGAYSARAYGLCRDRVTAFELAWAAQRGSAWFALALWLSQRDEDAVAARMAQEKATKEAKRGTTQGRRTRAATNEDGRAAARAAPRVSSARGKRDHALGPDTERALERMPEVREPRRGSNEHVPVPATASTGQLGFAGFD